MSYQRRVVDGELDRLLAGLPAVALQGARGVGKTETALQRASTVIRLDRPEVRAIIEADPDRLATGDPPILIDEWQAYPASWDVVRRAVDADPAPGRFLLTGSASPRNPPTHTGAGRIVSVRMRPMTLAERGGLEPTVSLAALLEGRTAGVAGRTDAGIDRYVSQILGSGLPGLAGLVPSLARAQLDGYLDQVIDRDVDEAGQPVRSRTVLRRWLEAYAAAISSTTSFEKIRAAASASRAQPPAKTTAMRYVDVLEATWLLDPVPAWLPGGSDLRRLTLAPKHQLVDPALAARLRRATAEALLGGAPAGPLSPRHATLLGALFEALVTLNVRVFAQAAEARVFHFRDKGGDHEIDLIVEGLDDRVVALEVKLTSAVEDGDVQHLAWLARRLGDRLAAGVVVTTGPEAYRRPDGIVVVPAALLGP